MPGCESAALGPRLAGYRRFFTTVSAAGLTGLLAILAVALLAGGYATIRRVTV
jgi:hypothetical protein